MSHSFTTVGQSEQRLMFEHGSFHLAFVTLQNWHFAWFSPGTFHSSVSILTLTLYTHTLTTVHATQSHNSTLSLTKTSVCVFLKNINKELVDVLCTESYGLLSGLNICTSLHGQRRNWYIIIQFRSSTGIAPLSWWWREFETWW